MCHNTNMIVNNRGITKMLCMRNRLQASFSSFSIHFDKTVTHSTSIFFLFFGICMHFPFRWKWWTYERVEYAYHSYCGMSGLVLLHEKAISHFIACTFTKICFYYLDFLTNIFLHLREIWIWYASSSMRMWRDLPSTINFSVF